MNYNKHALGIIAKQYKTRIDFKKYNGCAYSIARKNNWINDICTHMKKPHGYWTKDRIHNEALKYDTRKKFQLGNSSAYTIAHKRGWINDVCSHMKIMGNLHHRYLYVIFFNDVKKSAYVGLSINPNNRLISHCKKSSNICVRTLMASHNITYTIKLSNHFYNINQIGAEENLLIKKIKHAGYNVLNKIRGGGLGGNTIIWTKEKIHEISKKCTSRVEFRTNHHNAYVAASKNKWLNDVCSHMEVLLLPHNYWTKEKIRDVAKTHTTRSSFQNNDRRAYVAACNNSWLDEVCLHMIKKPNNYWTKDRIHADALKYDTRTEFQLGNSHAYHIARKGGYLNEVCLHMKVLQKPRGYYKDKTLGVQHAVDVQSSASVIGSRRSLAASQKKSGSSF